MLALGARGLVNAQFIVRDDGVYLIEVNPRASADRAVPVQGDRRADGRAGGPDRARRDARRARLGRRPAAAAGLRRGQGAGLLDGQAARRRPVGRARACSRPARSSGSHTDPRVALAKALLGAALVPPRPGDDGALALLSIADRDKGPLPRLARGAGRRRLPAGRDARDARRAGGRRATTREPVAKLGEAADAATGEVADPRAHRLGRGPARRQHADAALRRRSATPPRSATPRSPRGSCA